MHPIHFHTARIFRTIEGLISRKWGLMFINFFQAASYNACLYTSKLFVAPSMLRDMSFRSARYPFFYFIIEIIDRIVSATSEQLQLFLVFRLCKLLIIINTEGGGSVRGGAVG